MERFRTAVIDPPWNEIGGAAKSKAFGIGKRGADQHYATMKTRDMPALISKSGLWNFHENAHLYLWVTRNFLPDGLWLMGELGFRYVTHLAWVKGGMGLGRYFRGSHELCLFGVRGKGLSPDVCTKCKNITDVVSEKKTKHSAKPDLFFDLVERRSRGPYLEMFAREIRGGWTAWGDQITEISGRTNL